MNAALYSTTPEGLTAAEHVAAEMKCAVALRVTDRIGRAKDRPGVRRLKGAVSDGTINVVIIDRVSSLSPSPARALSLVAHWRKQGLVVAGAEDGWISGPSESIVGAAAWLTRCARAG